MVGVKKKGGKEKPEWKMRLAMMCVLPTFALHSKSLKAVEFASGFPPVGSSLKRSVEPE